MLIKYSLDWNVLEHHKKLGKAIIYEKKVTNKYYCRKSFQERISRKLQRKSDKLTDVNVKKSRFTTIAAIPIVRKLYSF